jgi:hypothetical protein
LEDGRWKMENGKWRCTQVRLGRLGRAEEGVVWTMPLWTVWLLAYCCWWVLLVVLLVTITADGGYCYWWVLLSGGYCCW